MERTITITGKARIAAAPDMTIVSVNMNGVRPTYEAAMEELCRYTSKLKDAVEASGLDRDSVKTSALKVLQHKTKVETGKIYDDDKWVLDGFEFNQDATISFPIDQDILSSLVCNISNLDITPRIYFCFANSNEAELMDRALAEASAEAKKRAEIIVTAVGCRLGILLSVNDPRRRFMSNYDCEYDWEYDCEDELHMKMMAECAPKYEKESIDITPRDVSASASVTLTWLIED